MASIFVKLGRLCFVVSVLVAAASAQLDNPFDYWCGTTGNFTINGTYQNNVNTLLASIVSNTAISYGFYNFSLGQSPNVVNAIALCRGDLNPADCRACISDSAHNLTLLCPVQKEAITWYEKCMVRYSFRDIFRVKEVDGATITSGNQVAANIIDQFNQTLWGLLDDLKTRAAAGDSMMKFAVGNTTGPTIFGMAQCTPDLSELNCADCLGLVTANIPKFLAGWDGGVAAAPSCIVRYETYRFYELAAVASPPDDTSPPTTPGPPTPPSQGKSSNTVHVALFVALPIVAVLLLAAAGCIIWKVRQSKKKTDIGNENKTIESLQYDFRTVRDATDNFSDENKLGQGGFGAVYKERLVNGQDIAVKRLSRFSGQGETEFRTEVLALAELRHRNLVRLLGLCVTGSERILIYEYIPNASLDHFIFDPSRRTELDWERRYKIIQGIARGLVYLHEDSWLRIIHRDLKASNILLDAEMVPKIADFGMARLFEVDQSQDETRRIVGTFSYMAPEYKMYGHLSVKTDVFSFGILVLEIISGQRNNWSQREDDSENLMSLAWRTWRQERIPDFIDPTLKEGGKNKMDDAARCFHVALLCIQQNAADRPSMASIVMMLSNNSITLPAPSQPAVYSWSSTCTDSTTSSLISHKTK